MWTLALMLLKRIPARDYLYLAAIVLTMSVGWWLIQHERAIGARDAEVKLGQMKLEYEQRSLELQAKNTELLQQAKQRAEKASRDLTLQQGATHALSATNTALLERIRVLLRTEAPTGDLPTDPTTASGGLSSGALCSMYPQLYEELGRRATTYAQEADLCHDQLISTISLYEAVRADLNKP